MADEVCILCCLLVPCNNYNTTFGFPSQRKFLLCSQSAVLLLCLHLAKKSSDYRLRYASLRRCSRHFFFFLLYLRFRVHVYCGYCCFLWQCKQPKHRCLQDFHLFRLPLLHFFHFLYLSLVFIDPLVFFPQAVFQGNDFILQLPVLLFQQCTLADWES